MATTCKVVIFTFLVLLGVGGSLAARALLTDESYGGGGEPAAVGDTKKSRGGAGEGTGVADGNGGGAAGSGGAGNTGVAKVVGAEGDGHVEGIVSGAGDVGVGAKGDAQGVVAGSGEVSVGVGGDGAAVGAKANGQAEGVVGGAVTVGAGDDIVGGKGANAGVARHHGIASASGNVAGGRQGAAVGATWAASGNWNGNGA